MTSDSYIDPDYPTKQSAGYMFIRLFFVQVFFMILYAFLLIIDDHTPSLLSLPVLNVSELDIDFIFFGIIANFGIFLLVFALWQSVEYRIASKHLYIERGLGPLRSESVIDFSNIDRCIVHETKLGRIFNYGTVEVFLLHADRAPVRLRGVPFAYQFLAILNAELLLSRKYNKKRLSSSEQ